ncbi:hypothetical protein [Pantoea sp. BAV 3049]|uniref:hypothetical protein n=1 Tax=Pantoea sp. BAV 3049 TaxID=2654188 RepID=UPI001E56D1A0|nr:hypothetical protein [Pantoea sp. BAV 3049]
MSSLIERTRNRLVLAALADLQDKTGSCITPVKLPDGSVTTVELDADIVTKALKKLFEAIVYDINKRAEAEKEIADVYSECVNVNHGKLTNKGQLFIGALIENLVEQAFTEREGK